MGVHKGAKRPDAKPQVDAETNKAYLMNTLTMWDWKKPDMTNPDEVRQRVVDYFKLCAEDNIKPSVEGLSFAFNVNRRTIIRWRYRQECSYPEECLTFIDRAYDTINVQMANYMQNNKINAVAGIFLMKNNMGYEDKTETVVATANPLGELKSADELKQQYLDAVENPKLAENAEKED